jgi:hypothetical protein
METGPFAAHVIAVVLFVVVIIISFFATSFLRLLHCVHGATVHATKAEEGGVLFCLFLAPRGLR